MHRLEIAISNYPLLEHFRCSIFECFFEKIIFLIYFWYVFLEYTINESDIYYGSFPGGFQFGVATASYQIEGGKELRGLNIWDKFTSTGSNIEDSSNGDTACDSYNKYHADVENVAKLGMDFYRFSISWPRLVPTGIVSEGINEVGIQYYHNLLDLLGPDSI